MQTIRGFYYENGNSTKRDMDRKIGFRVEVYDSHWLLFYLGEKRRLPYKISKEVRRAIMKALTNGTPAISREPFAVIISAETTSD